jgi:hypoxanthine phosphoribosyltransferase
VPIDYKGFVIPDKFVVGYGLDYSGRYRNLPFICVLKPEIYGKERRGTESAAGRTTPQGLPVR